MRAGWLAVLGMVAASGAMAQYSVGINEAYSSGNQNAAYSDTGAGKKSASHALTIGAGVGMNAVGDLSTGTLRADLNLAANDWGRVWLDLSDTLTVGNVAAGQVAHLDYLFNGQLTAGPGPYGRAVERMRISVRYSDPRGNLASNSWERNLVLLNSSVGTYQPCDGVNYPGQTCVRGTDINLRGTMSIPLLPGTYRMDFGLYLENEGGWDANFMHTARLFLDTPAGTAMSSASGVLFKTATPVPEPTSVALMLAGLGLVAGFARRRAAGH